MSIATREKKQYTHSVVSDQYWIHSNELKLGMYVSELDVPWEETSFMFQGFFVESIDEVKAVQAQASYVRVKSEKVARVNPASYSRLCRSKR